MRTVEVSRQIDAAPAAVKRELDPASIVKYEGSFKVFDLEEREEDWLVVAGSTGLQLTLRFEELETGIFYEQEQAEGQPLDAMETTITCALVNGGTDVTAVSEVSMGLRPAFLSDRLAAWKRKGELKRALDALAEDVERAFEFPPALPGGQPIAEKRRAQPHADLRDGGHVRPAVHGRARDRRFHGVQRLALGLLLLVEDAGFELLEPERQLKAGRAGDDQPVLLALLDVEHLEAPLVLDDRGRIQRPLDCCRRRVDPPRHLDRAHVPGVAAAGSKNRSR